MTLILQNKCPGTKVVRLNFSGKYTFMREEGYESMIQEQLMYKYPQPLLVF